MSLGTALAEVCHTGKGHTGKGHTGKWHTGKGQQNSSISKKPDVFNLVTWCRQHTEASASWSIVVVLQMNKATPCQVSHQWVGDQISTVNISTEINIDIDKEILLFYIQS